MAKRPNQIALTLPPQQRERLETIKRRSGRSVSGQIIEAVTRYLETREAEYWLKLEEPLPTCSQCGTPAPVAGYCSKGPLCPDCF